MTTYFNLPSTSTGFVPYSRGSFDYPEASGSQRTVFLNDDCDLNEMIEHHYQLNRIRPEKTQAVNNFLNYLQNFLDNDEELSGCLLEVFGSLANGLGSNEGDVDMSLRWCHSALLEKWEKVCVLQKVLPVLYESGCYDVLPVFNAKVPIIKFHFMDNETGIELDCDISINNELALQNTALIRQYVSWEPYRLPRLGSYVKKWAKNHNIGSAATGTISSYGHMVMLINYLQTCSPPVLPRLPEEFRTSADKKQTVEDSDVYFAKMVMPGWTRNRRTVAELFKGFLAYYASYDFENKVIQIRTRTYLSKSDKKWTSTIAIEDPFILSYNIGGHARESLRILQCFNQSSHLYNGSFEKYRREIQKVYQGPHSRNEQIQLLQKLVTDSIESRLSDSDGKNEPLTSTNIRKRIAASPLRSYRYEKQPLWIPPVTQEFPNFIPSTKFYQDSIYYY